MRKRAWTDRALSLPNKVEDGVHEHEKASKRLTSLLAMSPAADRRYTAPPPDFTRYKLLEIERHAYMAAWRLDGKPRTTRRFTVDENCRFSAHVPASPASDPNP